MIPFQIKKGAMGVRIWVLKICIAGCRVKATWPQDFHDLGYWLEIVVEKEQVVIDLSKPLGSRMKINPIAVDWGDFGETSHDH